jgi:hypothetical protein
VVREGEMPPGYYLALHPEARLTSEETAALIAGLEATTGRATELTESASTAEGRTSLPAAQPGDASQVGADARAQLR